MTTRNQDRPAPDRFDRLESRFAITDLIYEYARLIRQDLPDQIAALFTQDGVFEVGEGHPDKPDFKPRDEVRGRDQLHEYYAQMKGKPHPVPLLRNIVVEMDGDTARAASVMDAQIYGTEHRLCGEYDDTLRRVDGQWLFAARKFTIYKASSTI